MLDSRLAYCPFRTFVLFRKFTKKHSKGGDNTAELNPKELAKQIGLKSKDSYPKSNMKLKRLHWIGVPIKQIPKSVTLIWYIYIPLYIHVQTYTKIYIYLILIYIDLERY